MGELCRHDSIENMYCRQCNGDIVVSPSKKKVIGILLDVTGSMSGMKIKRAKVAVEKVIGMIPVDNNINVTLTVFSTRFSKHCEDIIPYGIEFTQQTKEMAIEQVRRLETGGDTPLYDVINRFLDDTWNNGSLDNDKTLFPYTYLIIVSDGEENRSKLDNLIYKGKKGKDAFFAKLQVYRDSGLVTEIIPFAYGEGSIRDIRLVQELENIIGSKDSKIYNNNKMLVNETNPDLIIDKLTSIIDSILYGSVTTKLKKIKEDEKDLINNIGRIKDREFLRNLLYNIEDMISEYGPLNRLMKNEKSEKN